MVEVLLKFKSFVSCDPNSDVTTPRSRGLAPSEGAEIFGIARVNRVLIRIQRMGKSASPSGNFRTQCKWSGRMQTVIV